MTALGKYVVIVGVVFVTPAMVDNAFTSGNKIHDYCQSSGNAALGFCAGYVSAVADVIINVNVAGQRACLTGDITVGQLRDVVVQYLTVNASARNSSAAFLVTQALVAAFPCRYQ